MLGVLRFTLLPAAESISVCAMHVMLRTASIPRDSDARTRVKETRKRETELIKLGAAKGGGQRERALSSACESRQGLSFYVVVKYAPTNSFSFLLWNF